MTAGARATRLATLGLVLLPVIASLAACERKTQAKAVNARPVRTITAQKSDAGETVVLTATTTYTLNGEATTAASLRNGVEVEVVAARVGNALTAVSVEIESRGAGTASVRGMVSGRTAANDNDFLVGSQRVVIVGTPQLVPGNRTLASLVNGVDVEVDGTLSSGVLTATRIKFR